MWLTDRPNNPKSGNFGPSSTQPLAANIMGITIPLYFYVHPPLSHLVLSPLGTSAYNDLKIIYEIKK
jgi:hypothetical protein